MDYILRTREHRLLSSLFSFFATTRTSSETQGLVVEATRSKTSGEIIANERLSYNLSFAPISPLFASTISPWVSEDALAQPSCERCFLTQSGQRAPLTEACAKTRNTETSKHRNTGTLTIWIRAGRVWVVVYRVWGNVKVRLG